MKEPCYKCKFEHKPIDREPCEHCSDTYIRTGDHPAFQWSKALTNYERLIRKTLEEMAEFLNQDGDCPPERMFPDSCPNCDRVTPKVCHDCWLDWLKQEVDK